MSGWYKMERGWQKHPAFSKEAYTEREAWEWLISEAAWKPRIINIKGSPVKLESGQLSHSIRHMADQWSWKKGKVERFLEKIEKWEFIETATGTGQTIITICEYTKYQGDRDSTETETGTGAGQGRDNIKEVKEIKKKERDSTHAKLPGWLDSEIWEEYRRHRREKKDPLTPTAEKRAIKKLERFRASGQDPTAVIEQSLESGWKGIFELKGENDANTGTSKTDRIQAAKDAALEELGVVRGDC